VHPYFRTVTSPRSFAAQMKSLKDRCLRGITLGEALRHLRHPAASPEALADKVVITFDDGFQDFLSEAFPVLDRSGFTATVFLASDFLGKDFVNGRPCLTAAQVRGLASHGIEFGSHSASHRRLVELDTDDLRTELRGSRQVIEDVLCGQVDLFSYPYRFPEENASFTSQLRDLLQQSGYSSGVTTAIGTASPADDCLFLPRLPVNDCDDERLLLAKVDGQYDWMRTGQLLRKRYRALTSRWRNG